MKRGRGNKAEIVMPFLLDKPQEALKKRKERTGKWRDVIC